LESIVAEGLREPQEMREVGFSNQMKPVAGRMIVKIVKDPVASPISKKPICCWFTHKLAKFNLSGNSS
jgi:hypothetical protein